MTTAVDQIVEAFQTLTPASVETLDTLYAPEARLRTRSTTCEVWPRSSASFGTCM